MANIQQVLDELRQGFDVTNDPDNRRVEGRVVQVSLQHPLAGVDKFTSAFASLERFIPTDSGTVNFSSGWFRRCWYLQSKRWQKTIAAQVLWILAGARIKSSYRWGSRDTADMSATRRRNSSGGAQKSHIYSYGHVRRGCTRCGGTTFETPASFIGVTSSHKFTL